MTAAYPRLAARAEARGRTQPQPQRRTSGQRLHAAHEHHRPEDAATAAKPRGEIEDAQRATVRIVETGFDDRGIAQVTLLRARQIDHVDGEHARVRIPTLLLQQRGKHRVAIGTRQARPDEARLLVDERGHLAIADDAIVHAGPAPFQSDNSSSQTRTAAGPGSHHSDFTREPTAIAIPS